MKNTNNFPYKKFIFLIPIFISFYLSFNSPNIFKDIKKEDSDAKHQKNLIDNLNLWKNKKIIENTNNGASNINKDYSLFFCIISDNFVKLVPFYIEIDNNVQDKITVLLNNLFEKPSFLDTKYQTLIPQGTRLISYEIKKNNIILNLNDNFLNTALGEDGKKLKIAQIVYTLNSINNFKDLYIHINGKNVAFLDRDGIIKNQSFNTNNIKKIIYYNYNMNQF